MLRAVWIHLPISSFLVLSLGPLVEQLEGGRSGLKRACLLGEPQCGEGHCRGTLMAAAAGGAPPLWCFGRLSVGAGLILVFPAWGLVPGRGSSRTHTLPRAYGLVGTSYTNPGEWAWLCRLRNLTPG